MIMRSDPTKPAYLAMLFVVMWWAQPVLAENNRLAREGHTLAVKRCGSCHATEKTGKSPHRMAPPFRSLAYRYPVETLDEALAEGISVGHPDMPSEPWEPADIARFIAYLKEIGPKQPRK